MKKIDSFKISPQTSIRDALEYMDKKKLEICMCTNNKDKVIGMFTKGDLKRAVFKKIDLDDNVKVLMNKDFIHLQKDYTEYQIKKIFKETIIQQLPVLEDGYLLNVIDKKKFYKNKIKKRKHTLDNLVVIMAGGKGTRLDPFTRILPKPLIPHGNDAIIKVIMDKFHNYGIKKFTLSVNEKSKMIKAYFKDHDLPYSIKYLDEDKPLGTIGAISKLKETLKNPFFIINCDTILITNYSSILNFHKKNNFDFTIVAASHNVKIPFGVCKIKDDGNLISLLEKPNYDYLVNTGVYICNPNIIKLIPVNTYFDITDLIRKMKKNDFKVGVFSVPENQWQDIGEWDKYMQSLKKNT